MWKKILPVLCGFMTLINAVRLGMQLSQPDFLPLAGQGLITLFWLALTVLCLRFFRDQRKKKD